MSINIKNEMLFRVYLVLAVVVVVALLIFGKAVKISVYEGDKWRAKADSLYVKYLPVEADRGNILAEDGALLATSLPIFDLHMDMKADGMPEDVFTQNVDSLAVCLSNFFNSRYTVGAYRELLLERRAAKDRFFLIKEDASLEELNQIKKFPLFKLGRYRGGLIVERKSRRERPYELLARRTIGYVRDNLQPIGLEGFFDNELSGQAGRQLMQRVGPDTWIPVNDLTEIEPKTGDDIKTTIDINLQEITQEALLKSLNFHNADFGTAVVMEVKTGAIRAISNIGRENGDWSENYNYAIGMSSEPGSTFKLASMMAILEEGCMNVEDTIDLNGGKTKYFEEELVDAEKHNLFKTTLRHAFEVSSNVGISKAIVKCFGEGDRAKKYIKRLHDMNLHLPIGLQLDGEQSPYIKDAFNKDQAWSGTTLPWMAIGYEVQETPMKILTLYNAVANEGEMMKPYFVSELQRFGETKKVFKPTVILKKVASERTIKIVKTLLEGVVENPSGTAHGLATDNYRFAGKTGTAQLNYQKFKDKNKELGGYQATFVGYFPAKNPVYSCIVTIVNPRQNGYYGAQVSGTVFREIADKCVAGKLEFHEPVTLPTGKIKYATAQLPASTAGNGGDYKKILTSLKLPYNNRIKADWAAFRAENDSIKIYERTIKKGIIPNVVGMGLRDALFLLENKGLKVEVRGVGKVSSQSVQSGVSAAGQNIILILD